MAPAALVDHNRYTMDIKKKVLHQAGKTIKKTFMDTNQSSKSSETRHADTVIRNHVIWSLGASFLVPIPIADVFAVSALQLDMIRQLCRAYNQDFSETQGKAIISALTTSTLARAGARSFIKLIPVVGPVVGGLATSIFNGASTYALGEVFKRHFQTGGTILDFDVDRLKKVYHEKFEKGKKVAEELRKEQELLQRKKGKTVNKQDITLGDTKSSAIILDEDPLVRQLKELGALRDEGIITEDEFAKMKQRIMDNMD